LKGGECYRNESFCDRRCYQPKVVEVAVYRSEDEFQSAKIEAKPILREDDLAIGLTSEQSTFIQLFCPSLRKFLDLRIPRH